MCRSHAVAPSSEIMRHHDQVAIWVLHEDFALAFLMIAHTSPDHARPRVRWPRRARESRQHRLYIFDVNLEHDAATIR
jgi:hypothetical protein